MLLLSILAHLFSHAGILCNRFSRAGILSILTPP